MKLLKIFTASFEESLNFEDDELLKWMKQDVEQPEHKEHPIVLFIISIALIAFNYGVARSINSDFFKDSLFPKIEFNFLPMWVFYAFLFVYIAFWLFSHYKRYNSNRIFWIHMNANNLLIWLTIEVSLAFFTCLFKIYPVWIWVLIIILLVLVIALMLRNQNKAIKQILFEADNKTSKRQSKILKYLVYVISTGIGVYMIIKTLFPSLIRSQNTDVNLLGLSLFLPIILLLLCLVEIYLEFPFILQNYYKMKYAEDYREWYGKNTKEWYGEKYFNKHIKGTEKEKKDEY